MNLFIKLCLIGVLILIKESSCTANGCDSIKCQNGGKCITSIDNLLGTVYHCECPPLSYGKFCEHKTDSERIYSESVECLRNPLLDSICSQIRRFDNVPVKMEMKGNQLADIIEYIAKIIYGEAILNEDLMTQTALFKKTIEDLNKKIEDLSIKADQCSRKYNDGNSNPNETPIGALVDMKGKKYTRYLGCYKDKHENRDLSGFFYDHFTCLTPNKCAKICKGKNFKYAGVQFGSQCFCGNSYGRYGKAGNCEHQCGGDKNKLCGGLLANGVYEVNEIYDFDQYFKYIGCYKDSHESRDLDQYFVEDSVCMTPEKCLRKCVQRNYQYAGLQNGCQCYCGNKFGDYGVATNCNVKCKGDESKTCGGHLANSIYEMNPLNAFEKRILGIVGQI